MKISDLLDIDKMESIEKRFIKRREKISYKEKQSMLDKLKKKDNYGGLNQLNQEGVPTNMQTMAREEDHV